MDETDCWWMDEVIGFIPRTFGSKNKCDEIDFIEMIIDTGILDEFYTDVVVEEDTKFRRFGRTSKMNYYTETKWGRMITDIEIQDSTSKVAREFRRKFRLPFPVFDKIIVPECDRLNVFEIKDKIRVRLPTDMKVLICLRILGRGTYQDDVAEMTGTFKSTIQYIFGQFIRNFTPAFYAKFVIQPTGDKRKKIMSVYSKIGLHGCMGSMDATHIFWARCPKNLNNLCTGKEHKPTLAWNCVVDHAYGILHVSDCIFGATNDMTLARNDSYPKLFANGGFEKVRFEILVSHGVVQICYGAYLITDSGYLKQNCFVCPMSNRVDRQAVIFSEFIESTRKDVECTFGQLKNRFRILKRPIEFDNINEINLIFKACCVMHNMILIYDHRDIESWEVGVDWELLEPDAEEPEEVITIIIATSKSSYYCNCEYIGI